MQLQNSQNSNKSTLLNYPIAQRSLASGAPRSDDPTGQRQETGEVACDGAADGVARRRRGLRRKGGRLRDLRDEPHQSMLLVGPRVNRR